MTSVGSSEIQSPSSDATRFGSVNEKNPGTNDFSTLEVVPPSNLEHYRRVSQMRRSFYRDWFNFRQDDNENEHDATAYPPRSDTPAPVFVPKDAEQPAQPPTQPPAPIKTICGMPQKAFWIVFGVIAGLLALGAINGGAVGGIEAKNSSHKTVTDIVTVTATPTATNTTTTATTTAECAGGTGEGNLSGLCSFACYYGYCPSGACTCTATGIPAATPTVVGVDGVPVAGENDEYEGLCSFCCNHGYCPSAACTIANSTTSVTSTSRTFITVLSSTLSSSLGTTTGVTTTDTTGTIAAAAAGTTATST